MVYKKGVIMEDIKEKSADEMFEELGYEKHQVENLIIYYFEGSVGMWIKFNLDTKTYRGNIYINTQELKAINKKIKELRMELEKCEYCRKGKILKSCNFCGSANLKVIVSSTGSILDIWGDENKFHIFKRIYRPRFDINYCPMCGRKLV